MSTPAQRLRDVGDRLTGRASLRARVEALEADVDELRRHHLRLAEITDVVQELLVPLAGRDQARVDEAIATFTDRL